MKIVNALSKSPSALNKFVEYLIQNEFNAQTILSDNSFMAVLGYILTYLETEKIFIIVDHNGYATYKQFTPTKQVVIECEAMQYNNIEQKYIVATIKAFNFIENPF